MYYSIRRTALVSVANLASWLSARAFRGPNQSRRHRLRVQKTRVAGRTLGLAVTFDPVVSVVSIVISLVWY